MKNNFKLPHINNATALVSLGILLILMGIFMFNIKDSLPIIAVLFVAAAILFVRVIYSNSNFRSQITNINTFTRSADFGFKFARHFIFWLSYLMGFSILSKINFPEESFGYLVSSSLLFFLPVDLLATYINLYVLMPLFLYRGHILRYILSISALAFTFSLVARIVFVYFYVPLYFAEYVGKISFWGFTYFDYLISTNSIVVVAAAIKLIMRWFDIRNHQQELESQSLKSELDMLKMQVNPHFLFNTLNNIDSLIYSNPDKASESIMKLSDLMRYMIYEAQSGIVFLSREVEYLNNMIALQSLRYSQKDFISFTQEGTIDKQTIGALLFVPFVENAIKHGNKSVAAPGILIQLIITENQIYFSCFNHVNPNQLKDEVGGIGLHNVKRRLEILYPSQHQLNIQEVDDTYHVELKIDLK
jgi:sensor histidine kinase YesM